MTKGDKELAWVFGSAGALLLVYLFWPKPATTAVLPGSASIALQPGATTVAVTPGGQVTLTLPQGASWASTNPVAPIQAASTPPSGNQTYTLVMSTVAGTTPVTASWTDSNGTAQITTVNIAVS